MVLEGLVAGLLNRVLGMYVHNFDPKQLNIGIWNHEVKLKNLKLRKEALDQLRLPLNVVDGYIGQLTLIIPFTNLRGESVQVHVEDVYVLAAPREDADYDAAEEETRTHHLKMEKLDSAELLKERNTDGMSKEDQQKQQSFTASLTTAVIDNLRVTVRNIHVRYEDTMSHPGHPFAAGLTLHDFTAVSTDGSWEPQIVPSTSGSSHKLARLGALAVYWDTDTSLIGPGRTTGDAPSTEEFLSKFKEMSIKDDGSSPTKHQYILKPVSGQAGLEMDKTGKSDVPKIKARLFFDELGFALDEDQYRDSLMLVDLFHYFIRHQETKKYQPKSMIKDDPKAWFRFAGNAVLGRIHDRNRKWSWDYFRERRDDRRRYIELFKKKKKEERLTTPETELLTTLEKKLTYEDLRFWRSLARNQLRKENVGVKKAPQKQSWSSWAFGGSKKAETDDDSQMTEEQRNELYAAIDWDEKRALSESVEVPKDTVKLQARVSLQTGSFTLKRDPHGKGSEILKFLFDNFNASFTQRPESFLTSLSLQGMRLYDGTTEGNLFPQTVKLRDAPAVEDESSTDSTTDASSSKNALSLNDEEGRRLYEKAFFALTFEQHPLDGSADSAVEMRLRGMEVVYNPKFVVEVVKFFKPPERHMESISALMDSAGEAVEGIRKQTRAGLEFALEEHKSINTHLDLQAPLIIVPDSVTQQSSLCLILDAGHISVNSELVDKDTIRDIQSKHSRQYNDEDYKRLEGLMYDKFTLKLQSTQVLIGPSIKSTRAQLDGSHDTRNLHLIDRINMDFLIETCIVPKGTHLTRFRITGNLPVLHASISDAKYKNIMRLLDVTIPKFEESSEKKVTASQSGSKPPDQPALSGADSSDAASRTRSKSFQFSSQRHELVMEEEDDEDKKQTGFHDTAQSNAESAEDLERRNFEFKFIVQKLQGSLFKADPEAKRPDELLAELVATDFGLDFYQRAHDMVAEVRLATLAVEDHVEQNPLPEFKHILTSEDGPSTKGKDLLKVKFVKVQKESPEFMTVYEGISTNLDVSVSTINLIVTRKTLLTLLDFVMVTFAGPEQAAEQPVHAIEDPSLALAAETADAASTGDKIRIKAELQKIAVVLNNDGIRLGTLSLQTATVGLTLMGKTMRLGAKLGNMSLIDDVNQGASPDDPLRQLLTIEGQEVADFTYETYDAAIETYPGHDSAIKLKSGSIKINFVTEPYRKIMDFAVKFGKMQAIFNAARQAAASQAEQIQQRSTKIQFDILIKTPIVVFPTIAGASGQERDSLTAYLGEIYAKNKFVPLDDSKNADTANELSAGIRNTRLESNLHYAEDKAETLELIDKIDLGFNITKVDHKPGYKRPEWEIQSSLSDINLRVTAPQLKLILGLSKSIPQAFSTDSDEAIDEVVENQLPASKTAPAKEMREPAKPDTTKSESKQHLGPELGSTSEKYTSLDIVFKAGAIGLELIQATDNEPVGDIKKAGLSKFAINQTNIKARMLSDGSAESELQIQSFTIQDTRERETNKFRKIMSLINSDVSQQFMASVTMSGGKERNILVILTVDSPRVILALDYVFAVQAFVNAGLPSDEQLQNSTSGDDEMSITDGGHESDTTQQANESKAVGDQAGAESSTSLSFRLSLVDPQILLIANPAMANSEAIVLGMKQAIVTQQHALTLQVEKVGMFLCRMDRPKQEHWRILDDFSIATSHDLRAQNGESSMTNIQIDIEPLVLRLSLRDIQIAMQIATKATSMSGQSSASKDARGPTKIEQLKDASNQQAKSARRSSMAANKNAQSIKTRRSSRPAADQKPKSSSASTIMKREEARIHMSGIRVVLIGDVHELPMLDWSVKEFDVDVRDWSAAMTAETSIDTFLNIYNFSKSAWEPLVEPWSIGFHVSQEQNPSKMAVELYSRKMLEMSLTIASISLLYKTTQTLSSDEDVLSKARTTKEPYRLRNYTGFTMNVWAPTEGAEDGPAAKLSDGEEIPWRFEDPATTRETLSPECATGVVGIKLEGSGFESIDKIPVNREGEAMYNLLPRQDKVIHRFLVEVKLGMDNIKYITFRSPLVVENNTQIPIELGIYSPEEGHLVKIEKIAPGESRPAPVGAAFMHSLLVRPDEGFGYSWSQEKLFWKDLLKKSTSSITCKGEQPDSAPPFYFQMHASYDKNDPLTRVYPYMRIRLSAPMEIHNLLPYDLKYRIYDKNTKKDWTNFLRKGGISPGHVVNVSHLLLLSVDLQDTSFKQSDYAIINSTDRDFKRETNLPVKDAQDLTLRLKLHYYNVPDTGGAFKVNIYSPYVILNKTGLELDIRHKAFMSAARAAAGKQSMLSGSNDPERPDKAKPFMFSFPTDDQKNRALIKVGESEWSKPLSFNAIGSQYSAGVPAPTGKAEMQIGVSIAQGEGKYTLTNVVTVAPRFVMRSRLAEEVSIREPGTSEATTLKPGELHPLRFLKQSQSQQLSLCFPGVENQWSSPFHISNTGRVHVKLAKAKQRQQLIKVEILMEDATIFLHLSQTDQWPYAIRNESDTEFRFFQANPNLEEDDEDRGSGFRAINYRIPPRSIMPYAWDYPASKNNNLVLDCHGRQRHIKLAEIGPQKPMTIPVADGRPKSFGVDVVADGPKQALVISNYKASLSLFKVKSGNASKASDVGFEVKEVKSDVTMSINLRLAGFGLSLINRNFRELLYLTCRDMELKYNDSLLYQTLDWTIKWIQIDNQLYGGIFPILLYPSVVPKTGKELEAHPVLHAAITRVKDDSYGVLYIKYATFLLQQMTLEIDEDFIFAMLDFTKIPGVTTMVNTNEGKLCDEEVDIPEPKKEELGQDVYFELLHLQPMQVDLSFVRTERINAEDTMTINNPFMFAVNVMTMSLGNVNDAPLRYNALMLENARIAPGVLAANIQSHFVQESLRQVHIVLGSADFLGNPVGLFNNVSSGVADIFYEPYQGLVMTDRPQDLGIGIAKGASSFVKKSVFGFSDSMAKFTGSISKGLAAASLDKEYQDQRRMSKARNRPKHALYGITSGGNAFANTMASGIGGLARQPLEGAEKEGLGGFVKGMGKGVLGFATKTALAPIDLTSSVFEGVRNTTTLFDSSEIDRVRPSRFIAADQIVRPYSQREALGQFWLKTAENGKYFNESYIAHLDLSAGGAPASASGSSGSGSSKQPPSATSEMLIMLTYDRIMLIKTKKLAVERDVPLKDIQKISKERTGMSITLKDRQGPFLPISDEGQRNFLYKQLAVAVNAYNEKWQAKG